MKIGIVSGYFNPLHVGHIKIIKEAKSKCEQLIVVVNNDTQQKLKKGKIIMNEIDRSIIISSLKYVDRIIISIDLDKSIKKTLYHIISDTTNEYIFFNGGDRNNDNEIPEAEICRKYNCELQFGVGGNSKYDSSTQINKQLGVE